MPRSAASVMKGLAFEANVVSPGVDAGNVLAVAR